MMAPADPSFWTLENVTRLFEIGEAVAVMATAVFGFVTIGAWRKENTAHPAERHLPIRRDEPHGEDR